MENGKRNLLMESELTNVSGGVYAGPCFQYTVQRGDNLAKIARRHGTTVDILVEINGIRNRNKIYIGQVLLIPAAAR